MKESDYFIFFLGSLAMTSLALSVVFFFVLMQRRQMRHRLHVQELKTEHHLDLLRSSIAAQEAERKRFAEDLHDDIGVVLSTAKLCLARGIGEQRSDLAQEALALVNDAMKGIRNISHDLLPPGLAQFGLWSTLSDLCGVIQAAGQLRIKLEIPEETDEPDLKEELSLGLYRVIKELLNNTIRHSGANAVVIRFKTDGNTIELVYSDNGKGIEEQSSVLPGLGLRNLESRISVLDGTIQFGKAEGGGLKVEVTLPLNNR